MAKRSRTRARAAANERLARARFEDLRDLRDFAAAKRDLLEELDALNAELRPVVARARADGRSWASIGESLGISGQAAGKAFGKPS